MALALLITSLVAFAVGPLLYRLAGRARGGLAALDGFVMVAVSGLVLVQIIPHAVVTAGAGALAVTLVGFIGPGLVEHQLERAARQTHAAALVVAFSGLAVHEFFDGVGLARVFYDPQTGVSVLAVAVVLHRLPIAVTVWWLLRPLRGPVVAGSVLGGLGAATVLGYASGDAVAGLVDARWLGLLEALIAGSLLHVVVHRPPQRAMARELEARPSAGAAAGPSPVPAPGHGRGERLAAGAGALLGLAAVVALGGEHHVPVRGHESIAFTDIFTALAMESAPALLLAFALAALVQMFLPGASPRMMRAGTAAAGAARGVVFGLPLPICSCGVVPLYETLVAQAVPATAALAFLVAAPALGIDSVLISLPLLGGSFTAVRVAAATLVALVVGFAIGRAIERRRAAPLGAPVQAPAEAPRSAWARARAGLRFGFGDIADHTAPWIVLGLALASLAEPALRPGWLAALPWGVDVLLFALLGMPIYVPASGAIPLVAVLINKGLSPGAALALLLTGPVINATSFGVLSRLHGRRVAAGFGALVAACAIGLGLLANLALPSVNGIALYQEASSHASAFQSLCLIGFTLVVALSVLRQGPRGFVGQILWPFGPRPHSHEDEDDDDGDEGHEHGPGHHHRERDDRAGLPGGRVIDRLRAAGTRPRS